MQHLQKSGGALAVIVNYKFCLGVRQLAAAFPPTHRFSVFANGNYLDDINFRWRRLKVE